MYMSYILFLTYYFRVRETIELFLIQSSLNKVKKLFKPSYKLVDFQIL